MSLWTGFVSGAVNGLLGGGLQGIQGVQGISAPIDGLFNLASGNDEAISEVAQHIITSQHAPVGTGESSVLNGRVYARSGGEASCGFFAAPASFEHSDQTREEADRQLAEGVSQIGGGVDTLIGDHKPYSAAEQIWDGGANISASEHKYAEANSEMMQAARDQVDGNRDVGGGTCVIA